MSTGAGAAPVADGAGGLTPGFAVSAAVLALGAVLASRQRALPSRWLVGLHVVRLPIGLAFLALGARGELHPLFATRAGWGDVVAGGLSLGALALIARGEARHRGALLVWNAIGFADIVMVVATAQRILLGTDAPEKMMRLAGFPGALLPTFLVPLVLFSHGMLFARWRP